MPYQTISDDILTTCSNSFERVQMTSKLLVMVSNCEMRSPPPSDNYCCISFASFHHFWGLIKSPIQNNPTEDLNEKRNGSAPYLSNTPLFHMYTLTRLIRCCFQVADSAKGIINIGSNVAISIQNKNLFNLAPYTFSNVTPKPDSGTIRAIMECPITAKNLQHLRGYDVRNSNPEKRRTYTAPSILQVGIVS